MSWGSVEQGNPASVLNSFNTEAIKLGALGVTVTISSGDDGVANSGCNCKSSQKTSLYNCACNYNSGSSNSQWTGTGTWTGTGYFPNFPATNPYITAVGATMGASGYPPAVGVAEIACQSQQGGIITTGGGFSTYYAQPSWQTSLVSTYFKTATAPTSGYNKNGRGMPDVAMIGVWYPVVVQNTTQSLFGTSASSPVFAALISLINAARKVKGLTSVGFINPTIYANQAKFNDVVSGYNKCCSYSGSKPSSATCCKAGFTAAKGWDPVTGLGSITYANLASIFGL
jgi:tripeptidyl-peptidase-1